MSAFRLTLRAAPPCRVDCARLVPGHLAGLSRQEIERLPLAEGRVPLLVGDVFKLRGTPSQTMIVEDSSERLDGLGEGLDGGSLTIEGPTGQRAGRQMRAGAIRVMGDTGPYAGSGMIGGTLTIDGDTGAHLGGGVAGEREGMKGGTIHVRGDAGARAGDRMRRGMIVIEGDAGEDLASRMIAGTIAVCGQSGPGAGTLMRRGTLLVGVMGPPAPTFVPTGMVSTAFARLLYRTMLPMSRRAARLATNATVRMMGDTATLGKGEVLVTRIG